MLLLGAACSPHLKSANPYSRKSPLRSIEDKVSTRHQLESLLGSPTATFEGDRIAVWYLDKQQRTGVSDTADVRYHLVAEFNQQGVVRRHSLVKIR